ncbi:MAG: polysaccharide biosynthesis protein [Lachnospiraceae bacterium]|nr:polysaccharide biosynthesis protein [Lachnospiraceae bacterium]
MSEETKKVKNVFNVKLLYRRTCLIIYDIISVIGASYLALLMRYNFNMSEIPDHFIEPINRFLVLNILITLFVLYLFRMYHSLWAFAGETELQNLVISCVISSVIYSVGIQFVRNQGQIAVPGSYYFLYVFLLISFIFASRFSYRFFRSLKHKQQNKNNSISVMVIGAGEAANLIIKEIVNSNFSTMVIRCIIDDDEGKWGRFIQGIKVVGGRDRIIECADIFGIDEIIVAMPSISRKDMSEILDICKETSCKLRSLPGMYQLVNGDVSVSKLRDVEVEDLLGRDPIEVDLNSILGYVQGKRVMVTGGGGSIGSELCRQIARHNPAQLILVDIYENSAYDVQQELQINHPDLNLVVLIASVRNTNRVNWIFEKYKPEIVYHAAAHKHVPLMETSPNEAVKNNVFGTWKTAYAAAMNGTKRFVMISTDKAVNPTNIMGASKRICEMIIQTFNKHYDTEFVAVRFGNVLGSNGSVIPLFKKQILAGGPVTVTHPDIIRYFMTIPEAVSLVLQAGAYAKGGEIFVLDMGKPVKILDLAKNLIRLSGYRVDEDIKIEFTGLRPGEKLYEELLMAEEGMKETANKLIHIGKPIEIDEMRFFAQLKELKEASKSEEEDIRELIKEIVPTYNYKKEGN